MRVFEYGQGRGEGPVDYVTHVNTPKRKAKPPEMIRGNPSITKDLINSLDFEWKYCSGVFSWKHSDEVSTVQENKVMNAFEELAFAGLEKDQYNILWIRHTHAEHHELHFVIPRVELYEGKSFNPCPPNWQVQYDPLRDYYNVKHGWHRPDNPAKRKLPSPKKLDEMKVRLIERRKKLNTKNMMKYKEDLIEYLIFNLRHGFMKNRDEVINLIHDIGFVLNRKGKDYITPLDIASGIKFRLKNEIFLDAWSAENNDVQELIHNTFYEGLSKEEVLAKLRGEIEKITIKRSNYNKERYSNADTVSELMTMDDAVNIDINSPLDEYSGHTSIEVKNDRDTNIYQTDITEDRTNEQYLLEPNPASITESITATLRYERESEDFGRRASTLFAILQGFYSCIYGIIKVLPRIIKKDRGRDLDNNGEDLDL